MVDERSIFQGLVQRGLPPHIAQGFVMNMRDESGLNPAINEVAPLVPGSRGGFGLYQLTGPRRVAYEQFANARGVDPANVDAQLDFLVLELQGPESRAARSIFAAQDVPSAAAAIARDFLRPAPENLQRRVAQYTGGTTMQPQGLLAPTMSGRNPEQERQPFLQRPEIADLLDTLAIGFSGMTLNPNEALIRSAQERITGRREAAQTQQQRNATASWLESQGLTQLAQGVRSGAITGAEAMTLARGETQDPYSTIGKLQADLAAGRINQEQYNLAVQGLAPQGMTIESTPDGGFRLVQGAGVTARPLTEQQSKDMVFATRAEGALAALEPVADTLTSFGQRLAEADPTGAVRGAVQTPEFQVAQQAGQEFLQAILRKDTGAAITEKEQRLYGETYLPQPGDGPAVLEQKRLARARAIEALKMGMNPDQLLRLEGRVQPEQQTQEQPSTAEMSDEELLDYYRGQ